MVASNDFVPRVIDRNLRGHSDGVVRAIGASNRIFAVYAICSGKAGSGDCGRRRLGGIIATIATPTNRKDSLRMGYDTLYGVTRTITNFAKHGFTRVGG